MGSEDVRRSSKRVSSMSSSGSSSPRSDNSEGEQATAPQRSKARGESRQLSETDR